MKNFWQQRAINMRRKEQALENILQSVTCDFGDKYSFKQNENQQIEEQKKPETITPQDLFKTQNPQIKKNYDFNPINNLQPQDIVGPKSQYKHKSIPMPARSNPQTLNNQLSKPKIDYLKPSNSKIVDQFKVTEDTYQELVEKVQLYFPFKPYTVQSVYMKNVIQALHEGQNALLESPTGTGKTLSLLCSTLSWLQHYRAMNPNAQRIQIIYTSRTHTQLDQVKKQLKDAPFSPLCVTLGSREHLCVNEIRQFFKGQALNRKCNQIKKFACQFYNDRARELSWQPFEIEELWKLGSHRGLCPYYNQIDRIPEAVIIFMPYNYLLDKDQRKDIDLSNSIIIIDEAHNIQASAEDSSSFEVSKHHLQNVLTLLSHYTTTQDVSIVKSFVKKCISLIDNPEQDTKHKITVLSSDFDQKQNHVFSELILSECLSLPQTKQLNSDFDKIYEIQKAFDETDKQLKNEVSDLNQKQSQQYATSYDIAKDAFIKIRNLTHQKNQQSQFNRQIDHYLLIDTTRGKEKLQLICLSAAYAFQEILNQKPRSLIFTSGTLSPLDKFEMEVGINFKYKLINEHVIDKKQIQISVLESGFTPNVHFDSSFDNRNNYAMIKELGNTLLEVCMNIPGGILLFFPSYSMLQNYVKEWENQLIFKKIEVNAQKQIIIETNDKIDFKQRMDKFRNIIKSLEQDESERESASKNGAVLIGVCRGKLSEGIDFSDEAARCVIVFGIPFPQKKDPKVILKKQFLDNNPQFKMSGQNWYQQEASRTVNQAIGRVIRHQKDYGMIILADQRFKGMKNNISKWLRDKIEVHTDFKSLQESTNAFFDNVQSMDLIKDYAKQVIIQRNNDRYKQVTQLQQAKQRLAVNHSDKDIKQIFQPVQQKTIELAKEVSLQDDISMMLEQFKGNKNEIKSKPVEKEIVPKSTGLTWEQLNKKQNQEMLAKRLQSEKEKQKKEEDLLFGSISKSTIKMNEKKENQIKKTEQKGTQKSIMSFFK